MTVVRRISGGGAMFIEPGNTITYSLSVPDALVRGLSFADSYAYLDDWVLGTKSAKKRVDPLRRQTGLPRDAVIRRMIESFRDRYGLSEGSVTPEEMARARELAADKFGSEEWTARVP